MKSGYVYIDNHVFSTLFAISHEEQSTGLMHQKWPPPVMAFLYKSASCNRFWMKNTPSPLDIVFSHKGIINQIHKGEPFSTEIIGDNNQLSDLIMEFPFGTVESKGIKIGQKIGIIDF